MGRSNKLKKLFLLMIQIVVLSIASQFCEAQGSTQNPSGADQSEVKDRLVRVSRDLLGGPVHIQYVRVGGAVVKPGVAFPADSGWLGRTQIVLSNNTNKEVVSVRILVLFPELGDGQPGHPIVGAPIQIGRMPESALYTRDGAKLVDGTTTMLALAPGHGMVIDLAHYHDALEEQIKRHIGTTDTSTLMIQLQDVFFADDSKWGSGGFSKPSETEKGKYVPITKDEFDHLSPHEH
jgi:hypothetical protein